MREPTPEVAEEDGEMIEEVRETIKKKEDGEMIEEVGETIKKKEVGEMIGIEEVGEVGPERVSGETGIMRETEDIRIRKGPPVQILRPLIKVLPIFI